MGERCNDNVNDRHDVTLADSSIASIARLLQTKIGRDLPKIGRSRMRRCFFSFCDCLSKAGYLLADCCLAWNPVPNPPLAPPGNLFGMAVLGCIFSRWVQGHLDAGRAGSRGMQTIVGPRSSFTFRAAVVVARPRPRKDAKSPLRHRARYAR